MWTKNNSDYPRRIVVVGGEQFYVYACACASLIARPSCVQPWLIIHKGWKKRGGNCLLCLNVVTPMLHMCYYDQTKMNFKIFSMHTYMNNIDSMIRVCYVMKLLHNLLFSFLLCVSHMNNKKNRHVFHCILLVSHPGVARQPWETLFTHLSVNLQKVYSWVVLQLFAHFMYSIQWFMELTETKVQMK